MHQELSQNDLAVRRVRHSLDVISRKEEAIRAWKYLDAEQALKLASNNDRHHRDAPLRGLVIGVKDIFDTADMPTCLGSQIFEGRRPAQDANVVARLRKNGATILGKTVTTEFASARPAVTRNPHNLAHSPGGSSSGSAAAVAAGMVPIALGTQTLGSIIRPASFCGVIGFKPSYGRINRAGVMALSHTLDTIGLLGRTVKDIARVYNVLMDQPDHRWPSKSSVAPKMAFCEGPSWEMATIEARSAFKNYAKGLEAAGIQVDELELPLRFQNLPQAAQTIHDYEVWQQFRTQELCESRLLSEHFFRILERGRRIEAEEYEAAIAEAEECRLYLDSVLSVWDCAATLSATGEAPLRSKSTGNPAMNAFWTLLHVPCLSLPKLVGPSGLPIGVQLIGKRFSDAHLLRVGSYLS